jgi:pre-mRNA-processing factor 6
MEDAEWFKRESAFECARAIYAFMINQYADKKGIWLQAAIFEKEHGTVESYEDLLKHATESCPKCETLWLMHAKSRWMQGNVEEARLILSNAFEKNPNSEDIWVCYIFAYQFNISNFRWLLLNWSLRTMNTIVLESCSLKLEKVLLLRAFG